MRNKLTIFNSIKILTLVQLVISLFRNHSDLLLWNSKTWLHFPLPGLEFLGHPPVTFILAWVCLISSVFLMFSKKSNFLSLGILSLLLMLLTTEKRFSFSYFTPMVLMALSFSDRQKSPLPFLYLLVFMYVSAALHKLFNLETMLEVLPTSTNFLLAPELKDFQFPIDGFSEFLALSVIPAEFLMGLLLVFKKTRFMGFYLCAIFHVTVGLFITQDNITYVGFMILSVHVLFVIHNKSWLWHQLISPLIMISFFLSFIISFFLTDYFFLSSVLRIYGLYGPFLLIAHKLYGSDGTATSFWKAQASTRLWVGLLFLWIILPVMNQYRNTALGWSMLSGAETRSTEYCLQSPNDGCYPMQSLRPIIRIYNYKDFLEFRSYQPSSLKRLQMHLEGQCAAELSIFECYNPKTK